MPCAVAEHPLSPLDRCRALLAACTAALRDTLPADHVSALLTLLSLGEDDSFNAAPSERNSSGWNLALRLCIEHNPNPEFSTGRPLPATWATTFLAECDRIARLAAALDEGTTGYRQFEQHGPRHFAAWRVGATPSTEERERADFDWWSAHLAHRSNPTVPLLPPEVSVDAPAAEEAYRDFGRAYIARFACQHSYPPDAAIGGTTFARFADILALLIAWLCREHDRRAAPGEGNAPIVREETALAAALADALAADPAAIGEALRYLTLDAENAGYHSVAPSRAAPPLIRLPGGRIAWSSRGLLGTPYLFLMRELRRRHGQEYHNRAHLREGVFRGDLYRLFGDKRFVCSPARVELRLEGKIRTDLDALIFDRKTGTLGIFELKAQDPFAGSPAERQYQRDNFFHANYQISTIARWLQRHGADEILARFDARAAKQFRVHKVHLFVLGRYLAHFSGGPAPDRRAAWGSWAEVLRQTGDTPFAAAARNPLSTLFARLHAPAPRRAGPAANRDAIELDGLRLDLYPSFAAYKATQPPN